LGQEDSEINSGFVNMSTWFRLLTLRPNLWICSRRLRMKRILRCRNVFPRQWNHPRSYQLICSWSRICYPRLRSCSTSWNRIRGTFRDSIKVVHIRMTDLLRACCGEAIKRETWRERQWPVWPISEWSLVSPPTE
jgi:hypothetical protein